MYINLEFPGVALDKHTLVSLVIAENITFIKQKFIDIFSYTLIEFLSKNHRILFSEDTSMLGQPVIQALKTIATHSCRMAATEGSTA